MGRPALCAPGGGGAPGRAAPAAQLVVQLAEAEQIHDRLLEAILANADDDFKNAEEAPEYVAEDYVRWLEGERGRLSAPSGAPSGSQDGPARISPQAVDKAIAATLGWCPATTGPDEELARALYCDKQLGEDGKHAGNHHARAGDGSEVMWGSEDDPWIRKGTRFAAAQERPAPARVPDLLLDKMDQLDRIGDMCRHPADVAGRSSGSGVVNGTNLAAAILQVVEEAPRELRPAPELAAAMREARLYREALAQVASMAEAKGAVRQVSNIAKVARRALEGK